MNKKIYTKGISVIEYSLLIAVVVGALLGISIYIERAICGRWRQAGDTFGFGRQYDPNRDPDYKGPKPVLQLWGK